MIPQISQPFMRFWNDFICYLHLLCSTRITNKQLISLTPTVHSTSIKLLQYYFGTRNIAQCMKITRKLLYTLFTLLTTIFLWKHFHIFTCFSNFNACFWPRASIAEAVLSMTLLLLLLLLLGFFLYLTNFYHSKINWFICNLFFDIVEN